MAKRGKILSLVFLIACSISMCVNAQAAKELKYYNALNFRKINYGFENSLTPYTRIPANLKDSVRPTLWERSQCSSGIGIRFATNSKSVGVRYNLLWNTHMAHMADTGLKGTDLYRLNEETGVWEFVNCNRPRRIYPNAKGVKEGSDSIQQKVYCERMDGEMHEYMIYLPLYDGINWMEIGVDSTATITQPLVNNPRKEKKFVFYGTSILQGGCATRTGMVGTSIIQRDLNVECVNIGISGEGKMDFCMARAMGSIPDVTAYIIDPVPNCTKDMCDSLTYDFIKILRTMKPDVPIFMVEGPYYSYEKFDSMFKKYLPQKNWEFHKNYLKLKAENPKNLYYIDRENLWGPDNEGTVDGIHITDIGFYYYAKKLEPYLKAVLEGKKVPFQKEMDKPWPEIK